MNKEDKVWFLKEKFEKETACNIETINKPSPNSSEWQGNSEMGSKSFVIMMRVSSPEKQNRAVQTYTVHCMANHKLHKTSSKPVKTKNKTAPLTIHYNSFSLGVHVACRHDATTIALLSRRCPNIVFVSLISVYSVNICHNCRLKNVLIWSSCVNPDLALSRGLHLLINHMHNISWLLVNFL